MSEELRDTRATAAYFQDVVESLSQMSASLDERAARPAEKWRLPKDRAIAADDALSHHWDLFGSLYSSGAPVGELRAAFERVLAASELTRSSAFEDLPADIREKRFEFGRNRNFYRQWLWLVSLALAFEVDDETFTRVVTAVDFGWRDGLLDRMIASRIPDHPVGDVLAFPRIVAALSDAAQAPSEQADKVMVAYLSKWYQAWKGVRGWGGHDFTAQRHYWGYWAFETVGVVHMRGLDDASFRDNEYYPRDLLSR